MADRSDEPLMQHGGETDYDRVDTHLTGGNAGDRHAQSLGLFVWLLTLSAGISGLLFGYDTGVISATLVSIGTDLSSRPLTTLDKSLIAASTSLCALIISPVSGLMADSVGRKRVILLADVLFIVGAVAQCASSTVSMMIVGRSVIGFGVGAASFVTPLYIGELAPSDFRGRLVTMNALFITGGQVVAYIVGWGFTARHVANGWRWMVGLGAIPAALQIAIMVMMPESPRWLIKVGRGVEARVVLERVLGGELLGGSAVIAVERDIEAGIAEEELARRKRQRARTVRSEGGRWSALIDVSADLIQVPGHRRALTIACLLQALQQLCGFNSLMYFSATLFSLIGFGTPTLTSLSVAVTNLIFTFVSLLLIDRIGRRRMLLISVPIMALALLCCAVAFAYIKLPTDTNTISQSEGLLEWSDKSSPFLVLGSIILYVAAYALGLGQIPWQQSELFPLSMRSLGSSVATATNWASNFLVGISFLPMIDLLSPTWTFVIYGAVCIAGWLVIWHIYPETMKLSLEETGALLSDGWGVGAGKRKRRRISS